jgi:hypothetical protein
LFVKALGGWGGGGVKKRCSYLEHYLFAAFNDIFKNSTLPSSEKLFTLFYTGVLELLDWLRIAAFKRNASSDENRLTFF